MKSKAESIIKEFRARHQGSEEYHKNQIRILNNNRKVIGFIDYRIVKNTLDSIMILVSKDCRKQGVSKALLAALLLRHNEITEMKIEVAGKNQEILEAELAKGKNITEAFKYTPAYKIRKALGFEVIEVLDERSHQFKCRKPENNYEKL